MKTQVKQAVSFTNEGREIAALECNHQHSQLALARAIAIRLKPVLLSMEADDAKRQLRADIAAAFALLDPATAEKRKASINVTATRWAAVIYAIASGHVWAKGAANIQHAYLQIATKRAPKKREATADTFKGDQEHAKEHMAKLNRDSRHEYASRTIAQVAESLKDGTQSNTLLAAALEFALMNPQAVLELAKAQTTLRAAQKKAA